VADTNTYCSSTRLRLPPSRSPAVLQCPIVGNLKQPAFQVTARAPEAEVTEQRQKHILDDVLCLFGAQTEGGDITLQRRCASIEQGENRLLDGHRRGRRRCDGPREEPIDDGIYMRGRHARRAMQRFYMFDRADGRRDRIGGLKK
jgi:hypothetical protein